VIVCPGCGVELPRDSAAPPASQYNASAECWQVYGEIVSYGALHAASLGRWYQVCVDSFGAQHVGENTAAITVAFALNGLYLVFERGFSGLQVREAHGYLANTVDSWDRLPRPGSVGAMTAFDVALAADPEEHAALVERWGRSVWESWTHVHDVVADLTDRQLAGWTPRTGGAGATAGRRNLPA
jgi:hypothetical protein